MGRDVVGGPQNAFTARYIDAPTPGAPTVVRWQTRVIRVSARLYADDDEVAIPIAAPRARLVCAGCAGRRGLVGVR